MRRALSTTLMFVAGILVGTSAQGLGLPLSTIALTAEGLSQCGTAPADCFTYRCDSTSGTWIETGVKAAGTACNDLTACTTGDTCDGHGGCAGTPLPTIDDHNWCTIDTCNPITGQVTHTPKASTCCGPNNTAMATGASCATGNACSSGTCDAYANCVATAKTGVACGASQMAGSCACSSNAQCVFTVDRTDYCYDLSGNLRASLTSAAGQACAVNKCP